MISDMTDNQQDLRIVSDPKSIDSSCQACDGSFSNEVKLPRQPGHLEIALLQLELLPVAELEEFGCVCSLQESCVCSPAEAYPSSSRNGSEKSSSERNLCTDGNGNERTGRCQKRRNKRRFLGGKRASSEKALIVDDTAETNRNDTAQYVRRSDSNLVGCGNEQQIEGCGTSGSVVVKDRRSMFRRSRSTRQSSPRRQLLNKSPSKRKSKRSLKDPSNSAFNDSIHSNADDAKDANEPSDRSSFRRSSIPGHTVTSLVNAPDLNSMEYKPPSDSVHEGGEMESLSNLLIKSCSTDNERPQVSPVFQRRHSTHLQKAASERSLFLSHHNGIHRNIMFGKKGRETRSYAMTKQQFFMGYSNLGSSTSTTQWDL